MICRPDLVTLVASSRTWFVDEANECQLDEPRFLAISIDPFVVFLIRYKRKFKEANLEITKLRRDLDEMRTAEIKALQAKKLEREERMMSEEHNDDSQSGLGGASGLGENSGSGQSSLLPNDDNLVSQDSCSEGSPNGLLKVKRILTKTRTFLTVELFAS